MTEDSYKISAGQLRSFVERYEALDAEKKERSDQQKEIMAEAKGAGYDPRALKALIAMRKKSPDELSEERSILEVYASALGMEV